MATEKIIAAPAPMGIGRMYGPISPPAEEHLLGRLLGPVQDLGHLPQVDRRPPNTPTTIRSPAVTPADSSVSGPVCLPVFTRGRRAWPSSTMAPSPSPQTAARPQPASGGMQSSRLEPWIAARV